MSLSSFGLEPQQYSQLAQQIDCIYHAAANINMLYPYETLQATNVQGTREVIQFAAAIKTKPIHYISSTAIFEAKGFFNRQEPISENIDLAKCEEVYGGYAQTKWVAEKLLQQAKNKGVPVNIYRLGMLTGHSQTGVSNTGDMLCKLVNLFIQQSKMPKSEAIIDMLPIDYAVQTMTHLSLQAQLLNQNFHFTNKNSLSFEQLAKVFNEIGYPVQAIDYLQWLQQLKSMPVEATENALGAMLPAFTEEVNGKTYLEFSSLSLPIQDDNTRQGLQNSQFSCPPVDIDLLKTYFSYFVRQGFLTSTHFLKNHISREPTC